MKKTYEKPLLNKAGVLSKATAQAGGVIVYKVVDEM